MRGRDKFRRAAWLFDFLAFLIRPLPRFLKVGMYEFCSGISGLVFVGLRYVLLKDLCKSIGENVFVDKYVCIKNFQNLAIGSNVSVHRFSYIDALGGISIGSDVSIAHNCSLVSFDHDFQVRGIPIRDARVVERCIKIGSDVWLGCGVRVLAGSVIVDRSVIGAGAVVSGVLHRSGVFVGAPARFIKEC